MTDLTHPSIYGSTAQVGYGLSDLRRNVAVIRGMLTNIPSSHTQADIQADAAALIPNPYTVRSLITQDPDPDIPALTIPLYRVTVTRFGPTKALVEAEYRNVFITTQPNPPDLAARVDYSTGIEYVNVYTVPTSGSGVVDYLPLATGGSVKFHMSDGPRDVSTTGGTLTDSATTEPEAYLWPIPVVKIAVSVSSSTPPNRATVTSVGLVNSGNYTLFGEQFTARELRYDGVDAEKILLTDGTESYVQTYKFTAAAHKFKAHAVTGQQSTLTSGEEAPVYTVEIIDLHQEGALPTF